MDLWLIFSLSGAIAGFLAGLLGIGGGFIVVPVLLFALPLAGIQQQYIAHMAVGTSLLCICVTSISSSFSHHKRQAVDWTLFWLISPGLIIGAITGSVLAGYLSGFWLVMFFVIGAFLTAIYLLFDYQPAPHQSSKSAVFVSYGGFTGLVSALIGIGGGSVLVPFLVYQGKQMVKAVGTAAACGFPIALFSAAGYAVAGWKQTGDMAYSTGYLYWPAFLGIVVFSMLTAPLGAKLAHWLPEKKLKQIFAIFLLFTGSQILYSYWQ
ncbi:MAG: sulfite exporter TauE/SafE family protein [Gammaproteobacteria bacterium]|nr:sulfite exporter TauE/SafE family protein [Gammaproteobacteria bacterium]